MAKKPESKLTQAKRLVQSRIDYIFSDIEDRCEKWKKQPQTRVDLTVVFGAELAALQIIHSEIIRAQNAGMTEADDNLRKVLLEAFNLPRYFVYEGSLQPCSSACSSWSYSEKRKFIELIS